MKSNFNKIRKISLTGATIGLASTLLVGCGKTPDKYTQKQNSIETSEFVQNTVESTTEFISRNTDEHDETQTQTQIEIDESLIGYFTGFSYNRRLYSNDELTADQKEFLGEDFDLSIISKGTDNADRRIVEGNYEPINIEVSSSQFENFNSFINTKDVVYQYASFYENEEVLNNNVADSYLKTLDLILLISPSYKEKALESINKDNIDEFYNLFNAQSTDDKKEVLGMISSIDYLENGNEKFSEDYKNNLEDGEFYDKKTINQEIKKDTCISLSKYFYKNLIERAANTNTSLQDIFYLINVFESQLNYHIAYDESYNIEIEQINNNFINSYIEIQDNFFEALTNVYNINEIEELFNNFALVRETSDNTYIRNAGFTWLEESEKNYIYNLLTYNLDNLTHNIRANKENEENTLNKSY